MTAVIQRVNKSSVSADGIDAGKIRKGMFILIGCEKNDTEKDAVIICEKILKLRIFSDIEGKINKNIFDIEGEILLVSNFTLLGSLKGCNRPDFSMSSDYISAKKLYDFCFDYLRSKIHTEQGIFGADMNIISELDGPVTIILDSRILAGEREEFASAR